MSDPTTHEGVANPGWPEAVPRILLYSHDSYGLGHFRRSSSIAHAIADLCPEASLLCVTGSPRADLFPLPQGADYVKLPSVTKSSSGEYVARTLDHEFDALVQLRAQTIATVARTISVIRRIRFAASKRKKSNRIRWNMTSPRRSASSDTRLSSSASSTP